MLGLQQTDFEIDTQVNGTCATIVKLHNASTDSLLMSKVDESFFNAPDLHFKDLDLTADERREWNGYMLHTLLRIAVAHGGPQLERFKKDLDRDQPVSSRKISLHKTVFHPLPSMNIDESSITGNAEVIEAMCKELQMKSKAPEFMTHAKLFAGDQLSIARLRSIIKYRAGHEGGFNSFRWAIPIPGLFHLKMAATQGVLETSFGKPNCGARNPGSLSYHNTLLDRKPIVLTSPPPFRVTRDLIFHSLYARVLHCFLQLVQGNTLDDFKHIHSYEHLKTIGQKVMDTFTDTKRVAEMRKERDDQSDEEAAAGDMVFENAILFLRDGLILRELTDAIKAGDSGRVLITLKIMAFAFRGNGRAKYANEMLHFVHNATHVWPKCLRYEPPVDIWFDILPNLSTLTGIWYSITGS